MQIAFIGLGTMGAAMAVNLLKAGYSLSVWNRSDIPVAALTALGATAAPTAAAAAEDADLLISMLADDAVTRAVIIDGGVLDSLKPGAIHVNMATVSVAFARAMAQRHSECQLNYIAAPVLGRVNVAEAGQLQILAAGDAQALEKVQPVLDVLGQKTWRFGEAAEQANVVKLAVNFMIASAIETMGEASSLVKGHGISGAEFIEMISSTLFAVPVYKGYGGAMAKDTFEPAGFKLALGGKDVRLALEAADEVRVPLPIGSVLRDSHLESMAHNEGHLDWAALARVSARRAGQL